MKELEMVKVKINLNDEDIECEIPSNITLLELLRDYLDIKSVKSACWQGDCGLCTVLFEGKPLKSCLCLAIEADGKKITTVEGLSKNGELSDVQKSFIEAGAIQCGFCSSAFILVGHYLVETTDGVLSREKIAEEINGILCRCTGYKQIIDAIELASKKKNGL